MPSIISRRQRQRAKELRQEASPIEREFWNKLRLLKLQGFHFRKQQPISRYYVDFICLKYKLAVELDGFSHENESRILKDREKQHELERQGFRLLRFLNTDVKNNIDGIMEMILVELRK